MQRVTQYTIPRNLKSLRIYDSDCQIKALNIQSSFSLHERECFILYKTWKSLEAPRNNLSVEIDGVCEKYE